jgi:F-type H+-transporting ATPase subunit gamma
VANLRDLRKRRKSAANTRKITRTMELVASAKLKKAQEAASASRPYAEGLRTLIARLAGPDGTPRHPLLEVRQVRHVVLLVATADRGLAGAFNANLVAVALARAAVHRQAGCTVEFIALGKKATSTLEFLGNAPSASFTKLIGTPNFTQAQAIAQTMIERFLSRQVDLVEVIYARFASASRQIPEHYQMLPVTTAADPAPGGGREPAADFIYEPDPEELLAALIPRTVATAFFSALLQTSAAEHAARRVAMKNATDAAADMVKSISSAYNRGRQGKITQEIAEIVGAVEAMS